MKKKLIITFSTIFGIIAVLTILCFTLFALRKVEVDFRTSTSGDFPTSEEIVTTGDFAYKMPVIFANKKRCKENIEKKFPYVEVINIETVFPNKMIIHVKQREEIYAFIHGEKTYYCDNKLVVLRSEDASEYLSTENNSILLEGLDIGSEQLQPGDKLKSNNYVDFYDAMLENNRQLFEQKQMIKSINFENVEDANTKQSDICATIDTFDNHRFYIYNCSKYLTFKVQKFISAYSGLYDLIGESITQDAKSPFYGQVWTKELLDEAYVVINNYYNVTDKNKPCYVNVFPKISEEN